MNEVTHSKYIFYFVFLPLLSRSELSEIIFHNDTLLIIIKQGTLPNSKIIHPKNNTQEITL